MKNTNTIIATALFAITASAQQSSIGKYDLNGDGTKDKVEVAQGKITVNGKIFDSYFDGNFVSFKIIDINTEDNFKEIEVLIDGPNVSDYLHYWYNKNNTILKVGETGIYSNILGNGIVYGGSWGGYYPKTKKYVLTKDHKLDEVVADYYSVNKEYKVAKSFEIFTQFDEKSKVLANVAEKSTITIVAETKDRWVLIKTSNGLLGWAKIDTVCGMLENCTFAG
jgi:hypothetical protein